MTRLAARTAIVTGGGSGIGRAIAERFAAEGARVALAGQRFEPLIETAEAIESHGGRALAVVCDVAESKELTKQLEKRLAAPLLAKAKKLALERQALREAKPKS